MFTVEELTIGCFLVEIKDETIIFGSPPEIIKVLMNRGKPLPTAVVLPANFFWLEEIQAELEFPLFHFLFFRGGFSQGERLKIIGTADQTERIRQILRLTLLGPDESLMRKWHIPTQDMARQLAITHHFALKTQEGSIAEIDDLVEFIHFKEGKTELKGLHIEVREKNCFYITYQEEDQVIDLNFYERQKSPMKIQADPFFHLKRPAFGLLALSHCTSGFDPIGFTTGLVIFINSMPLLIDGPSWTKEHLRAFGLSISEIKGIILSHNHGDHASVIDAVISGHKVNLITIKEVYRSFVLKLSLLIGWPEDKIKKMIYCTEVPLDKPFYWFGATFNFFRAVHTIATIGFEVNYSGKKIIYSGDTVWGEPLQKLLAAGIVDKAAYDTLANIFNAEADLVIMDGGGGLIHPDPTELNKFSMKVKRKIYLTHRSNLPEGITGLNLIRPGQQWEIIPAATVSIGDINAIQNSPLISTLSQEWLNTIYSQGKIEVVAPGQEILQEGETGKDFYIIIDGAFSIIQGNNELTRMGTGDFFGEIPILEDNLCTFTVKTTTKGRMMVIPRAVFLQMAKRTIIGKRLLKLHQMRPALLECGWVKELPLQIIDRLAEKLTRRTFKSGEIITHEGEKGDEIFYLERGKVSVFMTGKGQGEKISSMAENQFFGELAVLGDGIRTATVIAEEDTSLLVLRRPDFERLKREYPILFYAMGVIAEDRIIFS
ncbi:MAG: cyclic nucleotide-binding domain-containing protein [Deltaproteobacteria bacterium]|nr:cyclic nucleotide-binding domain-containing protein [Deltaproteobacteria bacterium]